MKKKCINTLLVITLLIGCSTDESEFVPAFRRIVNNTPYEVRLELTEVEQRGDITDTLYLINPMDSISIEGVCDVGPIEGCYIGWAPPAVNIDIIFDNKYIQSFEGYPTDFNQKAINAEATSAYGYALSREGDIRIYTYTITQEDFDSADPL